MPVKHWYIKISRYLLGRKFLRIMNGYLEGYWWTTQRNYGYITGDYEDKDTVEQLRVWCKRDTVCYDIGANVGYHSFLANAFLPDGIIYAFEPIPANIDLFRRHEKLNAKRMPHNNISLLTFGISDREKTVEFSNDEAAADGNTYIATSGIHRRAGAKLVVQCFSIDNLLQKAYEPPTIMKIDVEGAEYDVLCGAAATIKKYKPNILLATHDYHLPGVKDKCVRLLQEWDYELKHTGTYNKQVPGLDDFIAVHRDNIPSL